MAKNLVLGGDGTPRKFEVDDELDDLISGGAKPPVSNAPVHVPKKEGKDILKEVTRPKRGKQKEEEDEYIEVVTRRKKVKDPKKPSTYSIRVSILNEIEEFLPKYRVHPKGDLNYNRNNLIEDAVKDYLIKMNAMLGEKGKRP